MLSNLSTGKFAACLHEVIKKLLALRISKSLSNRLQVAIWLSQTGSCRCGKYSLAFNQSSSSITCGHDAWVLLWSIKLRCCASVVLQQSSSFFDIPTFLVFARLFNCKSMPIKSINVSCVVSEGSSVASNWPCAPRIASSLKSSGIEIPQFGWRF